MQEKDFSMIIGKVSNALDDGQLYYLDVKIEWEAIAKIFDIFDEVGTYENGIFEKYPTDIIVANIFKKDKFLFNKVFTYIAGRYRLQLLNEYMMEYESVLDNGLDFTFENEMDADNLKMFISFNSNDDEEAEKIQKFFIKCGVDCFLSKTSIDVSDEYKKVAFDEICKADIFIYLLSEHSKSSDWCDQEMGMAYMKYKLGKSEIFVVSHDGSDPYGFLSSFNAKSTCNANYLFDIARKIDEKLNSSLVETVMEYYDSELNSKIKELYVVGGYLDAKSLLSFINKRSHLLTESQLRMICEAAIRNDQIYECIVCKEPLINMLSDCKDLIDDDLYRDVFNKINPIE